MTAVDADDATPALAFTWVIEKIEPMLTRRTMSPTPIAATTSKPIGMQRQDIELMRHENFLLFAIFTLFFNTLNCRSALASSQSKVWFGDDMQCLSDGS